MGHPDLSIIGRELDDESAESSTENGEQEESIYDSPTDDQKLRELLELQSRQIEAIREETVAAKSLYALRFNYAIGIFVLITLWLSAVMFLVYFGSFEVMFLSGDCKGIATQNLFQRLVQLPKGCGVSSQGTFLKLSENIVVALVTTTTINVLGLALIVARWLFPLSTNPAFQGNKENS